MNSLPVTPSKPVGSTESNVSASLDPVDDVVAVGYAHGISSKKRAAFVEDTDSTAADTSLDCVVRSKTVFEEERDEGKELFDRMDINQMFSKARRLSKTGGDMESKSDGELRLNHSPVRIDISSPIKADMGPDSQPPQKRLKLGLNSVPALQPEVSSKPSQEGFSSPAAIPMVETKSSPDKLSQIESTYHTFQFESYDMLNQDTTSQDGHLNQTPQRPLESSKLEKLTPLHEAKDLSEAIRDGDTSSDDSGNGVLEDREYSQFLLKKNETLSREIFQLNKELRDIIATHQNSFYDHKIWKSKYEILDQKYKNKIVKLNQEIQNLTNEREDLQNSLNSLKRKASDTKDEIRMLSQNQMILQEKYDAVSKESEGLKNTIETLERENHNVKEEKEKLQIALQDAQNANEGLSMSVRQIEGVETENTELKQKVTSLEEELEVASKKVEHLEYNLKESLELQQDTTNDLSHKVEKLSSVKRELENDNSNLVKENEEIMKKLKALQAQLSDVNDKFEVAQKSIEELERSISNKHNEIESLKTELEKSNDNAEVYKAQLNHLNEDREDVKETETYLRESITKLEKNIEEWKEKYEAKTANFDELSLELESVNMQNKNIEAEHLAELEQLHDTVVSLQKNLKDNTELISKLTKENETLHKENNVLKEDVSKVNPEIEKLNMAKQKETIEAVTKEWENKLKANKLDEERKLKLLADDLYLQYSSKHEQKVKQLRKEYEKSFQSKLQELRLEKEGYSEEVKQLNQKLAAERKEKQRLLEIIDTNK